MINQGHVFYKQNSHWFISLCCSYCCWWKSKCFTPLLSFNPTRFHVPITKCSCATITQYPAHSLQVLSILYKSWLSFLSSTTQGTVVITIDLPVIGKSTISTCNQIILAEFIATKSLGFLAVQVKCEENLEYWWMSILSLLPLHLGAGNILVVMYTQFK